MAKSGVYQENGQWYFLCPQTQVAGGPFADRPAARTAYQTHRQTLPPAPAPVAGEATSAAPKLTVVKGGGKGATTVVIKKKGKKAKGDGSRFNGAVGKAWTIFGKHPKGARKAAITEAIESGINPNTAKTQYQRWLHRDDDKKTKEA